jgi:hypothetical protein
VKKELLWPLEMTSSQWRIEAGSSIVNIEANMLCCKGPWDKPFSPQGVLNRWLKIHYFWINLGYEYAGGGGGDQIDEN